MVRYVIPALYTLFLWWFSTMVIMFLDRLPRPTFRWSFGVATLLLCGSLVGMWVIRDDASLAAAYAGVTFGTIIYGWVLMSFYFGYLTGPRQLPFSPEHSLARRFWHALYGCLYHELIALGGALALIALTWGHVNQVGTWTFVMLWLMKGSAKLNVFLGVRNFDSHLLPKHLQWLSAFATRKPMNTLFPLSMLVLLGVAFGLIYSAIAPTTSIFQAVGLTFLIVLTLLALFEHGLLMQPSWNTLWGSTQRTGANSLPSAKIIEEP
jgi:putative photosynthetic complex assembly protein 2